MCYIEWQLFAAVIHILSLHGTMYPLLPIISTVGTRYYVPVVVLNNIGGRIIFYTLLLFN